MLLNASCKSYGAGSSSIEGITQHQRSVIAQSYSLMMAWPPARVCARQWLDCAPSILLGLLSPCLLLLLKHVKPSRGKWTKSFAQQHLNPLWVSVGGTKISHLQQMKVYGCS